MFFHPDNQLSAPLAKFLFLPFSNALLTSVVSVPGEYFYVVLLNTMHCDDVAL